MEIVVVVGIIGLLATVIYAGFDQSRASTRDKTRQAALEEMALAIEFYRAQNGRYPAQGCTTATWAGKGSANGDACNVGFGPYVLGLTPDYIDDLPIDPRDEGTADQGFMYRTNSGGTAYKLMVQGTVEVNQITSYNQEYARCPRQMGACSGSTPPATTYAVYSIGAEDW